MCLKALSWPAASGMSPGHGILGIGMLRVRGADVEGRVFD